MERTVQSLEQEQSSELTDQQLDHEVNAERADQNGARHVESGIEGARDAASEHRVERRSEPRIPVDQYAMLKIVGWAGLPNPMQARIVDVSGHGMRLHVRTAVVCGSDIEIEAPGFLILGEVCRCQQESSGYALGVRISQWFRSDAETPKPQVVQGPES